MEPEIVDVNFKDEVGVAHVDTEPKGVFPTNKEFWYYDSDDDYDGQSADPFISYATEKQMRRDMGDEWVDRAKRDHYAMKAKGDLSDALSKILAAYEKRKDGDEPITTVWDGRLTRRLLKVFDIMLPELLERRKQAATQGINF